MHLSKLIAAGAAALALAGGAVAQPPDTPKDPAAVAPKDAAPTVVVPASAPAEPPAFAPVDPRYSFRYDGGNGVGYRNGFFLMESFYPFAQVPGESLSFGNARVLNYLNSQF